MAKNLRKPKIGVKNPATAVLLLSFGCGVGVCILLLALAAVLLTHTGLPLSAVRPMACMAAAVGAAVSAAVLARRLQKRLLLCGLGCGAFYAVCLLAATLLIGACTPAMEIYRGICHIAKEGTFCLENEEPYTLADRPVSLNFETQNCENKLFFTYFAK